MTTEQILKSLERYGNQYKTSSDDSLLPHLIGTHDMLKRWGCSDDLCQAGLCNSVYGPESYTQQTVPFENRSYLKDTIGERSENIAYLFGALQKKSLWTNLGQEYHRLMIQDRFKKDIVRVSVEELKDLITLTLAKGLEQRDRLSAEAKQANKEHFLNSKEFLPAAAFEDFKKAYGIN